MKEIISVIVPVYNVCQFLDTCIGSIICQSYQELDIIIVDDGSTDGSELMCDAWQERDERIRVIHQSNAGLSEARNTGIAVAKGKYITFIDSDDFIESDMLAYLFDILTKNNAQISICQYKNVDENNLPLSTDHHPFEGVISGCEECMKHLFTNKSVNTAAWAKLYLTDLFKNIRYPSGKYHEDVFTTYKLIAKCSTVVVGKEQKYNYRWRQSGISKRAFSNKHLHLVEACIERNRFILNEYPHLSKYSKATIVYASNVCTLKYIKSELEDKKVENYLQKQYRQFEHAFLACDCRFISKIFSILAYSNLHVFVKTSRFFLKYI